MYGINPDEQPENPMDREAQDDDTAKRLELTGVVLRQAEKSLELALEQAFTSLHARDVRLLMANTKEVAACIQRRDQLAEEFLLLTKQLREEWEATRGEV